MDGPTTTPKDRQFSRHSIRGEARLEPLDEGPSLDPPLLVMLQDIGRTGVKFMINQNLDVDSTWRLRFLHHGFCIGTVPLIVRYVKEVERGNFHAGGQFMIEPYILNMVGVSEEILKVSEAPDGESFDLGDFFAPPDAVEDN